MHTYKAFNAPMATTALTAKVTTGTAIKTMLQIATPSTRMVRIISWGYDLDAVPGSTGGEIELIQTDVAATVTAHVAAGVQPQTPGIPASLMTLGSSATGYTATAEGTPAATKVFDTNFAQPSAGAASLNYEYQWAYDERPFVDVSKFLRVRVLFAAAVNMLTWVCWDE